MSAARMAANLRSALAFPEPSVGMTLVRADHVHAITIRMAHLTTSTQRIVAAAQVSKWHIAAMQPRRDVGFTPGTDGAALALFVPTATSGTAQRDPLAGQGNPRWMPRG